MVALDSKLGGVLGKKSADKLRDAFGMETVRDLLAHYPRRLDDRGELTDFSDLRIGEHATVLAKTVSVSEARYQPKHGRRHGIRTEVIVTDGRHDLRLTFFQQRWIAGRLEAGTVALFSGRVDVFRGRRQLTHPHCDILGRGADLAEFEDEDVQRWWPIYPATAQVSSKALMECVAQVLRVLDDVADPLPDEIRSRHGLVGFRQALGQVHEPADPQEFRAAQGRLRFDEAFVLQTALAQRRHQARLSPAVPRVGREGGALSRFDKGLPFDLTPGQQEIGSQISADLAETHPMHRLLQGEVGSGKTVVALRAMLQAIDSRAQAALLAPTEVLAAQHYRSVVSMLGPIAEGGMLGADEDATRVVLLTGSMPAGRRRAATDDVSSGAAGVVIGTHALLEEQVRFADLGLVVVDEQHRFGVEQRAALTSKSGAPPHVLVMTATPIPRTVAMTVFGDLEVSTLRDMPPDRPEIQTAVVPAGERPDWLHRTWARVREEVEKGHQAYVVCPRIGGDPESAMQEPDIDDEPPRRPPLAVADVAAELVGGPLAGLRVFMLHGRLPADEKDEIMRRFAAGDIEVLVATTVIEVGVDVANASVMVVMDADRFGVSQLHQLRGRVGRGTAPGLCLLVTEAPDGSRSRARLDGVAATLDGFELSRLDLESRREGDVLGATQSGRRSSLRLLSVLRDEAVIEAARAAAEQVVEADPTLDRHAALAAAVQHLEATEQATYLDKS